MKICTSVLTLALMLAVSAPSFADVEMELNEDNQVQTAAPDDSVGPTDQPIKK